MQFARPMIGFFAERINDMGVSRDHILVATHDAPDGDMRVEINYVSYQAHTDNCGDWSEDLAFTADNRHAQEFRLRRCSRISPPMVADPRDLIGPRAMDAADADAPRDRHQQLRSRARSHRRQAQGGPGNEQSGTSPMWTQ